MSSFLAVSTVFVSGVAGFDEEAGPTSFMVPSVRGFLAFPPQSGQSSPIGVTVGEPLPLANVLQVALWICHL